jgi:hypothetical protein
LQAQTGLYGGAQELVGFGLKGHGVKLAIKFAAGQSFRARRDAPDLARGIMPLQAPKRSVA